MWVVLVLVLQALASVQPPEEKKVEKKEEEVKPPSPPRPKVEATEVSDGCRLIAVVAHHENRRELKRGRFREVERWFVKCAHCKTAAASMGSRGLSVACNAGSRCFDPFVWIRVYSTEAGKRVVVRKNCVVLSKLTTAALFKT